MRTSISEARAEVASHRPLPLASARHCAGFTLVEILVVVLLVAITVSLAALNLGRNDRDTLREEAARLAASYRHAQDEAVLTGVALGWRADADGYAYFRRTAGGEWQPLGPESGIPGRRLAESVRLLAVEAGGIQITPGAMVVLPPSGVAAPVRMLMEANAERAIVEIGFRTRVQLAHGS